MTEVAPTDALPIAAANGQLLGLLPHFANRHGLVTGATGTGKTVTLQRIAEQLSLAGVPVFLADAKGDLSGLGAPGVLTDKLQKRLDGLGIRNWQPLACPTVFWDVFGEQGHPVRATVSDMGPLLMGRLLDLNDTQEGVLQLVFKVADDEGLLLLDLKDLRAMVQHVGEHAADYKLKYGNVSAASIGAIQRGLLTLESQGGEKFFGEPMLDIDDLMQTGTGDLSGRGVINVLAADKLMNSPRLYASFLLWLLSELFERLPEAGDLPKPKLVFFFDEAHLLFTEAPPALLQKVEQVVRLIRSKGVGVYFVTQNPLDIPDTVLGQLGNRVQHALRAFTPRDQKAVKSAAETLRANSAFDAATAITELGVGEALVSFLDDQGRPNIVERARILPPGSRIGPLTPDERRAAIQSSILAGHYEQALDRESAYERLNGIAPATPAVQGSAPGSPQPAAAVGSPPSISAETAPSTWGPTTGASGPSGAQATGSATGSYYPPGARPPPPLPGRTSTSTPSPQPTAAQPPAPQQTATSEGGFFSGLGDMLGGSLGGSSRRQGVAETAVKSAVRTIGTQVGREIARGLLGSILGGRRR